VADEESQVDGSTGQRSHAGYNGARYSPFFACPAYPGATMGRSSPAADSDLERRGRATRPSAGEGGGGGEEKEELVRRRHGESGLQWWRHGEFGRQRQRHRA
jgi:hypothetical protein